MLTDAPFVRELFRVAGTTSLFECLSMGKRDRERNTDGECKDVYFCVNYEKKFVEV